MTYQQQPAKQHDAHVDHYRIWLLVSSYMDMWKQGALAIVELWEKSELKHR